MATLALPPVQAPQVTDPISAYSQASSLGSLLQQKQLRQQQIQAGQLENQQRQRDQQDQQIMMDAHSQFPGDHDQQRTYLEGKIQPKNLKVWDDAIAEHAKTMASQKKEDLENIKTQTGMIGSRAQSLLALPDDALTKQFPVAIGEAQRNGLITPESAPPPEVMNDPAKARQWLQMQATNSIAADKQVTQELDRRKDTRDQAEQDIRTADEARKVRGEALQALSSVQNQDQFDTWRAQYPDVAKSMPAPTPSGLITKGNINLNNRPVVKNADGTTSTVKTITIEEDGHAVLLPTVINGKVVSDDEAIKHYEQTGEHMGIFKTEKDADDYDRNLHNQMGWNGAPGSGQAKWQQGGSVPFDPAAAQQFARQAVPVKEQPEFDLKGIEAAAAKNATPASDAAMVDKTIDPKTHSDLNARTKALVESARKSGMPPAAIAGILKDGADQIGRTETAVATAKATAPIKISLGAAEQAAKDKARLPSDDAIDLMAEDILNGKYPSSRNPVLYAKAMDRAAAVAKERGLTNQQVLLERNAASANNKALAAVTKQYETLKPFADMAEKNADILEQKSKLITDLGASIINTPIRNLESAFTGNTNVAAFRAALMPVQADFARILNSPTGNGVLSDHARSEMETAIKPGATVGELKAAVDVFRTDAKNRREAYEANIEDLKKRSIAGGGNAPAAPPANKPAAVPVLPATLSASDVGKTYTRKDGKKIKITAVNPKDGTQFRSDEVK